MQANTNSSYTRYNFFYFKVNEILVFIFLQKTTSAFQGLHKAWVLICYLK